MSDDFFNQVAPLLKKPTKKELEEYKKPKFFSFFCPNCGTKEKNNTIKAEPSDYHLKCSDCGVGISWCITDKPSRTIEEADASFQATELTDSQRGTKRHSSQTKIK